MHLYFFFQVLHDKFKVKNHQLLRLFPLINIKTYSALIFYLSKDNNYKLIFFVVQFLVQINFLKLSYNTNY